MTDTVRYYHPPDSLTRKYRTSFKEGAETQMSFTDSVTAQGYEVLPVSMEDDSHRHIDVRIRKGGQIYSVDIKGRKRIQRGGDKQDSYVCLELHGAQQNSRGWLYGGSADLIAFETVGTFLLVCRTNLAILASFFVGAEQVSRSADAVYKRYGRRGHEQITWVETDMLRNPWVLFDEIQKADQQVTLTEQENGDVLTYVRR